MTDNVPGGTFLGRYLAATRDGAFKLTFAALVIAAAMVATVHAARHHVSSVELAVVLALGMAVSGVLLLGALSLSPRSRTAANAALAVVTLASVFTAYLVHTELFYPQNRLLLAGLCAAALFGLFVAFQVIDERRWGGIILSAAALVAVSSPLWPDLAAGLSTPGGVLSLDEPRFWLALVGTSVAGLLALFRLARTVNESHLGMAALLAVVSAGIAVIVLMGVQAERRLIGDSWEIGGEVRPIAFQETPNVYFVGFESIVPESILRKYLDIQTTDFHSTFDREARRFRNMFANNIRTYYSFNTILALDQDIFLADYSPGYFVKTPSYFAGNDLSPLLWIMRENGYETTSMYRDNTLGSIKGAHVDNYVLGDRFGGGCVRLDEDVRTWAFWGYCHVVKSDRRSGGDGTPTDALVGALLDVGGTAPQFVIAHVDFPGHTAPGFLYDNEQERRRFGEWYRERSKAAAVYLERIVEHLRSSDPTAILFIFGDHGMHLSKGVEVEKNPEFYLQDRYAVLGGVYPKDRCAEYFDEAEAKGYVTTLDAIHAILGCLSGGQSALLEPRRDRFLQGRRELEYDYREVLYE